jgi:hypothetical protein
MMRQGLSRLVDPIIRVVSALRSLTTLILSVVKEQSTSVHATSVTQGQPVVPFQARPE